MSESPKMFFDVVPAFNFNVSVDPAEFGKNPNLYFESADVAFMIVCSALVFLMIPGVGFFYSGVSHQRSAMSMIWLPMMTAAVIGLQWYLLGYSLVFSSSSNKFWGSANSGTLHGVLANPAQEKLGPRIPELVYTLYQGMFACFTASLVSGAVYKKHRVLPFLIFIFIWSTLVYDPIARWSWNPQGWSALWGTLDFAGGTVVHIVAATTTAVYANFVKVRARIRRQILPVKDLNAEETPSNVPHIVLGTILLWFGWFGFNGGSALGANLRAVSACISTNIAACMGGVTGCFLDWYLEPYTVPPHVTEKPKRKFSIISFCNGVIAGLVAITPAAGFVPVRLSFVFGLLGALFCGPLLRFNDLLYDPLGIVVVHGVGGFIGMILTGIFARADIAHLDGYTKNDGGFLNHNWKQLYMQLCDALAAIAYSGTFTFFILMAMELVMNQFWDRPSTETDFEVVVDADDILDIELQAERVPSANGAVGGATSAENGESPEAIGAVNLEGAVELHPLPSS